MGKKCEWVFPENRYTNDQQAQNRAHGIINHLEKSNQNHNETLLRIY